MSPSLGFSEVTPDPFVHGWGVHRVCGFHTSVLLGDGRFGEALVASFSLLTPLPCRMSLWIWSFPANTLHGVRWDTQHWVISVSASRSSWVFQDFIYVVFALEFCFSICLWVVCGGGGEARKYEIPHLLSCSLKWSGLECVDSLINVALGISVVHLVPHNLPMTVDLRCLSTLISISWFIDHVPYLQICGGIRDFCLNW